MLTSKHIIIINIVLAVILLLCLFDMPYGYYQMIRYLALVAFGVLAYDSYLKKENLHFILNIALAILFQPLSKISLGRDLWNIVDVTVAVWLIYYSVILYRKLKT